MQITLTEALKEIKILEDRINKASNATFVGCVKQNNVVVYPRTTMTKEELSTDIKANYQSITDLIDRRILLKTNLMKANNITNVTIGGKTMSLATAIEQKNSIGFKVNLLQNLKNAFVRAMNEVQKAEEVILHKYDETVNTLMGGKDSKVNSSDFSVIKTQLEAQLSLSLVDTINIESKIKELEKEIEDFLGNIDTQLSIANATNFIEA